MNAEDVKLCNCAECGCELLGDSMRVWYFSHSEDKRKQLPQLVYLHLNGRPYCMGCSRKKPPPQRKGTRNDISPWQENAIRHLEDER